jgi:uncharacterized protein GlcG (DUF336 family)
MHLWAILLAIALPGVGTGQSAPPASSLTYEIAHQAAEAAEAEARRNQWNVSIVVVDSAGAPVYLKPLTGASARTFDIAMRKARTSAASGLSTLEYAQRVSAGTLQAIPDAVTIEGGIPIIIDGKLVGAIAASGVRANQDAQVAQAGAAAVGS